MDRATRSLSPKQIAKKAQLHRQAVLIFARLAAKQAVQQELREQGVRVSVYPYAQLMRQAKEYLDQHPELYRQAKERAERLGYVNPLRANVLQSAQSENEPKPTTSAVQILGAK